MELVFITLTWLGSAGLSSWLAQEKGRPAVSWLLLGLVFGLVTLVALAGAPSKERR